MNRSELVIVLGLKSPQLTEKDIDLSVRLMLDAIAKTLATGGRVEIRGFGSFCLNYRKPRSGRNPKTGVTVSVPAKYVPHFKPGKELCERVDERLKR